MLSKLRVTKMVLLMLLTVCFQYFAIKTYALLDLDATVSFVTHLVDMKFDVARDVLIEPFSVCTLVGDSFVSKRFYMSCPILLSDRFALLLHPEDELH